MDYHGVLYVAFFRKVQCVGDVLKAQERGATIGTRTRARATHNVIELLFKILSRKFTFGSAIASQY